MLKDLKNIPESRPINDDIENSISEILKEKNLLTDRAKEFGLYARKTRISGRKIGTFTDLLIMLTDCFSNKNIVTQNYTASLKTTIENLIKDSIRYYGSSDNKVITVITSDVITDIDKNVLENIPSMYKNYSRSEEFNKQLSAISDNTIKDCVWKKGSHVIVFVKNSNLSTYAEYNLLITAYNLLKDNDDFILDPLFKKIAKALIELKDIGVYIEGTIKDIILDFLKEKGWLDIDYKSRLTKICTIDIKYEMNSITNEIEHNDVKIKDYLNRIQELKTKVKRLEQKMNSLIFEEHSYEDKVNQLMDVLTNYKNIAQFRIEGDVLNLLITQNLEVNDKEQLKRVIHNYTNVVSLRELLVKTFCDEKYDLRTYACIYIKPKNNTYGKSARLELDGTHLPHPHIMRFNCFGAYTEVIQECLEEGCITEAIEQMLEIVKGISAFDSPVMREMVSYIEEYSYAKLFVNKETGVAFSLHDYEEGKDGTV